jgi:3-deoxy-D-manno-octulosonic-acid transferase
MLLFYKIVIRLYFSVIYLFSFFNKKAGLWINGRRDVCLIRCKDSILFHFASLGEFEQGRPVLEQIRILYPDTKIIVTFFSPSGYEVRKNTPLADAVYYLPLDTKKNARDFMDAIQPKMAIFTKYEYWYYFYSEMYKRNIPVYIISGIFRPGQVFFKWYGGLHRQILGFVAYFFVQDEKSKQLLADLGLNNVSVSGDTRFDRVWANAQLPKELAVISQFKNGHKLFIAGSTWPPDEKLIVQLINSYPDWKFIFAPHEISEDKIKQLEELLPRKSTVRFSQISNLRSQISDLQVLIIDNIGMLSALYQYGEIAYIGGGFGAGIHNTLEAAAFGLPVIFGPNYAKFKEAHDLVTLKAGFSIEDETALKKIVSQLKNNALFYQNAAKNALLYVKENTGATSIIIDQIAK